MFIIRNVEDERQARERQARAHRLEGVGMLAAGLAHDFNNLVMVMRGYAELLPPSGERWSILTAVDEAGSLITNPLAFGRQDVDNQDFIDLRANILKWTNMLQRLLGSSIRLETHVPALRTQCGVR